MDSLDREPKDHRLFHYTSRIEFLDDMLRHGFWPRYCEEDFEWLTGRRVRLAFPMVCFCDIPLEAANTHRNRYGDYAIGFNKSAVMELDINPVWYIHERSSLAKHLASSLTTTPRFTLKSNETNPFLATLPFIKPTISYQPRRGDDATSSEDVFAADEEMEWRHSPTALLGKGLENTAQGFVKEEDHLISNEHRLTLDTDQVDCVLVPHDENVSELSGKHPCLATKIMTWEAVLR